MIQQVLDWFVALNFGSNVFSPRVQFDFGEEEKPLLQDMLQVIDKQIPVDMESFYRSYGIVPPQKDRKN